jgi:hypothetical protein
VCNAKRIWDLLKIVMDDSDGEGNGYADGEEEVGEENAGEDLPAGIPAIPQWMMLTMTPRMKMGKTPLRTPWE